MIHGLELPATKDVMVFHAGTKKDENKVLTNGGRVLAISAYGKNITEAVQQSKNKLSEITFEGMYFRKDIGYEFGL
ncbi:Phosphoribosylamine--glycine ligase [compost metagenome]